MAATHSPLPSPLPPYPALSRLRETTPLERNGSTSSSRSTATVSSTTSSLVAVEMRPPPKETRTAASGAPTPGASSSDSSNSDLPDLAGPSRKYHPSPPEGIYGGRGFQRNGPRSSTSSPSMGGIPASASAPTRRLPAIVTDQGTPSATPRPSSSYIPGQGVSPTTPRAGRFFTRPVSSDLGGSEDGEGLVPSPFSKLRTSSMGGPGEAWERERERRQSIASAKSAASGATAGTVTSSSGRVRETAADYVFGEELGRGSYSTVVHAIRVTSPTTSPSPASRPPRQFAVKIINQAHLIQERKTKYAMIERDALVRLNAPRAPGIGGPSGRGHRRGMSGSSTPGTPAQGQLTARAVVPTTSGMSIPGDRTSIIDSANSSYVAPSTLSAPLHSPTLSTSTSTSTSASTLNLGLNRNGRRPSRSADPPEVVPERSDEGHEEVTQSRPVSPVVEEREGFSSPEHVKRVGAQGVTGEGAREKSQEVEKRPASRGPPANRDGPKEGSKDRSRRSGVGKGSHPGIIRLYSTFNDVTSLYFVLELAGKGELLTYLRKFGSLDVDSARYYAALLLDTVEFMHERGVVHRDLKPENILLDDEMRLKVTDFGSAKLVDKDGKDPKDGGDGQEGQSKKRSFVGSADFVSPEVLRNEPALAASDVWAFGCIVYQLIVGKPPFRGATDYLTFQKILKREMEFPDGFDADARSLVEVILNLDPAARPNPSDLKVHPFFSSIDWRTLWHAPAAPMATGITPPVVTLASIDPKSDIWAVFEDELSDNGMDPDQSGPYAERIDHQNEPRYDRRAAADAVWAVDSPDANPPRDDPLGRDDDLEPPKPAWMEAGQRKLRALSKGSSARTSSSSSGNRTALTGLLETMGIVSSTSSGALGAASGRTSRASGSIKEAVEPRASGDAAMRRVASPGISTGSRAQRPEGPSRSDSRWNQLLLTNETILYTSAITLRTSSSNSLLPSFLSPNSAKRRQLILTDLPRLFTVKEESPGSALQSATSLAAASQASLSVKNECVFVAGSASDAPGPHSVVDIGEKGAKGFTIQTPSQTFSYIADTAESRSEWLGVLKQVMRA